MGSLVPSNVTLAVQRLGEMEEGEGKVQGGAGRVREGVEGREGEGRERRLSN